MLEKLVHTGRRIPKHQVCVTFDVPDGLTIAELPTSSYHGWNAIDHAVSRKAGDAWLETRASVILLVPSVVFEVERNALINPAHPEAKRIRVLSVESIRWDDRLFG
jgi:RES domain-containing protein